MNRVVVNALAMQPVFTPRHQPSTPHALQALKTAREIAGYEDLEAVETRHVLWSILSIQEAAATRLLRRLGAPVEAIRDACKVQRYGVPGNRAREFDEALTRVGLEARSTATSLGDERVGTAHLLLGLFADGPTAEMLRRHGVTRARVSAEILRIDRSEDPHQSAADEALPGGRPTGTALCPAAVTTVGLWVTLQIIVGVLEVLSPMFWHPLPLLEVALRNALSLALIGPLVARERYAWSTITALLFAQCGFWCAASLFFLLKMLEGGGGVSSVEVLMIFAVPFALLLLFDWALIALARGLFAARWWFGVGEREGWTTMKREGGWVLVLMGLIYGYALVQLAMIRGPLVMR